MLWTADLSWAMSRQREGLEQRSAPEQRKLHSQWGTQGWGLTKNPDMNVYKVPASVGNNLSWAMLPLSLAWFWLVFFKGVIPLFCQAWWRVHSLGNLRQIAVVRELLALEVIVTSHNFVSVFSKFTLLIHVPVPTASPDLCPWRHPALLGTSMPRRSWASRTLPIVAFLYFTLTEHIPIFRTIPAP